MRPGPVSSPALRPAASSPQRITQNPVSPSVSRPPPRPPHDQYRESQSNAGRLLEQIQSVDAHRDAIELDLERASLKSIGLGVRAAFPDARYLRMEEDDNRFWATGLTDAGGDIIEGSDDDLGELELFGEDELANEVHSLSCTDTRWLDEVSTDDALAPGLDVRIGTVIIDLDKAAALELAPARSRIEAEVVTEEARDILYGAVDDALGHLEDILDERASDYTEDDLDRIRERIAGLQRLVER